MKRGRLEMNGRTFDVVVDGKTPDRAIVIDDLLAKTPKKTGIELDVRQGTWRAPVRPSKIVCIGRNYAAHAKELGNAVPTEPTIFLKPPSSIVGPSAPIVRPKMSALVHHEAELAVVIGKKLAHATEKEAEAAIFGFTCANDVTARDLQRADGRFTRAKGFDSFCPVGPFLVDQDQVGPIADLTVTCRVNNEVRQQGSCNAMVFPVPTALAYISSIMTLLPGDLILTGTPEGVGPLVDGDVVEVEISPIGTLRNPVVDAA